MFITSVTFYVFSLLACWR